MSYILVSDKPTEEYAEFLAKTANELNGHKVRGIAMVALMEGDDDCDAMTAYWNMGLMDRQEAASHIQADVTVGIIRANLRDMLGELEEDGEDEQ